MQNIPPLRVGELAYANTAPFRLPKSWAAKACPSPKALAQWADDGKIDAGVVPVVEAWRLEDRFDDLGHFGIAVKNKAGSVLLISQKPWSELDRAVIGATDHSSTSVKLLNILLTQYEGVSVKIQTGFSPQDTARLVIGDEALRISKTVQKKFPHTIDLGEVWHRWTGAPFVFARWVVRRTVPQYMKQELLDSLGSTLDDFDRNRKPVAQKAAKLLNLSSRQLMDYFDGFIYRLGERENQSEQLFRDFVSGRKKRGCC